MKTVIPTGNKHAPIKISFILKSVNVVSIKHTGLFLFILFYLCGPRAYSQGIGTGNYPDTAIRCGQNIKIAPKNKSSRIKSAVAYSYTKFQGVLSVDTSNGMLQIINGKPEGRFPIFIKWLDSTSGLDVLDTLFLSISSPVCSQGSYQTKLFDPGSKPTGVAVADFNGDMNQDLIVTRTGGVSVLLGDGKGAFEIGKPFKDNTGLGRIVVADFNGDGNFDFAASNNSRFITVAQGNGKGEFGDTTRITVLDGTNNLATGDFNRDGFSDLAIANKKSISICLGSHNGRFQQLTPVPIINTTNGSIQFVVVTDFNNDSIQDLATANINNGSYGVSVCIGDKKGGFGASIDFAIPFAYCLSVGDFNKDHYADLIVGSKNSSVGWILIGKGNGNFDKKSFSSGLKVNVISNGDLNGDGHLDFFVPNEDEIRLFLGDGKGGFKTSNGADYFQDFSIPFGFPVNLSTEIGDFNEDGRFDLVLAVTDQGSIFELMSQVLSLAVQGNFQFIEKGDSMPSLSNHTQFGFRDSTRTFTISNIGMESLILVTNSVTITGKDKEDFTVLVSPDSIIPVGISSVFTIQFNPGKGEINRSSRVNIKYLDCNKDTVPFSFSLRATHLPVFGKYAETTLFLGQNISIFPDALPNYLIQTTAFGDKNFKGNISVNPITGEVNISNARPAGKFNITVKGINSDSNINTVSFVINILNYGCPKHLAFYEDGVEYNKAKSLSMALADFDGNHKMDIAIANYDLNTVSIRLGIGSSFGEFGPEKIFQVGDQPRSIISFDANGDGFQDFATANFNSHTSTIYLGDGKGDFKRVNELEVGTYPGSLAHADVDLDGHEDLVLTNYSINKVAVFLGNGKGAFKPMPKVNVGLGPYSIVTADFNGDGKPDFATCNLLSNNVSIRFGNGEGYFYDSSNITVGNSPIAIAHADFNNDGQEDLITANWGSNSVSTLINAGIGNFSEPSHYRVESPPLSIALGDLNHDSFTDLLVATTYSKPFSIELGNGLGGFNTLRIGNKNTLAKSYLIGNMLGDPYQGILVSSELSFSSIIEKKRYVVYSTETINDTILDFDYEPSILDGTDFNGKNSRGYAFKYNLYPGEKIHSGKNSVTLSGADASSFIITKQLDSILSNPTNTFKIDVLPGASVKKTAIVNIKFEDCNAPLYSFAIAAAYNPALTIENREPTKFQVYPSPNNGLFELQFYSSEIGNIAISISDVLGRAIYNQTQPINYSGKIPISIDFAQEGTYFIKALINGKCYIKKLVLLK